MKLPLPRAFVHLNLSSGGAGRTCLELPADYLTADELVYWLGGVDTRLFNAPSWLGLFNPLLAAAIEEHRLGRSEPLAKLITQCPSAIDDRDERGLRVGGQVRRALVEDLAGSGRLLASLDKLHPRKGPSRKTVELYRRLSALLSIDEWHQQSGSGTIEKKERRIIEVAQSVCPEGPIGEVKRGGVFASVKQADRRVGRLAVHVTLAWVNCDEHVHADAPVPIERPSQRWANGYRVPTVSELTRPKAIRFLTSLVEGRPLAGTELEDARVVLANRKAGEMLPGLRRQILAVLEKFHHRSETKTKVRASR